MSEKLDINELQVKAWRAVEALADRQFDLTSVEEMAEAIKTSKAQARRILLTWEFLGIAERRGEMWRLTESLMNKVPQKLRMALLDKQTTFI